MTRPLHMIQDGPPGRTRPEYYAWTDMRRRCGNAQHADFSRYGGRGIRVCAEWQRSFALFLAHMGPRPSQRHSLDRIDNERGYEPGNVRWALPIDQANNRRVTLRFTFAGETRSLTEWARVTGINKHTLRSRLTVLGWTPARALGGEP